MGIRRVLPVAAAAVAVCAVMGVAAGQAQVAHAPRRGGVGKGALAPVRFSSTGREQTYTVPAGVIGLEVQAVAADGAVQSQPGDPDPATAGTGAMVSGELAVGAGSAITPGETLYVGVGGTPTGSKGGFNGGGSGTYVGGGGGGATDLRTCSPTAASCANGVPSPLTRLIVAAGGGGAGGCDPDKCNAPFAVRIGSGGSAGQSGGDPFLAQGQGIGGGGGTLAAVGSAGPGNVLLPAEPGGIDGSGGRGSPSPDVPTSAGGGGGGGGYFGGGGGGVTNASEGNATVFVSGGGGGGANFASPWAASNVSFGLGDGTPRVVITPQPASAIQITRISYNSPGPDTGTNTSLNGEWIRLANTGRSARQLHGWWITNAHGNVYRFARLTLRPGASVTVHSGHGRDSARDRYWNHRGYVWDNARDLARFYAANGMLADRCRYNDPHHNQIKC